MTPKKNNWPIVMLETVCEYITVGHVGPMVNEYCSKGIPFLRSQNVRPFRFDPEELKYISEIFHGKLKKSTLRPKDVVVTRSGANTGQCCIIPEHLQEANCSDLVIFRPSSAIDPWFLMYVLNSDWGRATIAGGVVGAAQCHFNIGTAKRLLLPLPPLPIQRRIAGILSAYDDLIENNRKRIAILDEMARRLYREWFVHFRYPGHESVPLVDSPLGRIPQGWDPGSIAALADVYRGKSYRSEELVEDGGIPFINLKCINRDGGFRRDGIKGFKGEHKSTHVVRPGDVVMAVTDMTQERRIVARAAMIPNLNEDYGVISMDLVRIVPKPHVSLTYLYFYFRFSDFSDNVKQHANGANVLHLHPDRISGFSLAIPDDRLMKRFSDHVGPWTQLGENLAQQNDVLRRTRDLLLPRLMSGRLSVTAAEAAVP